MSDGHYQPVTAQIWSSKHQTISAFYYVNTDNLYNLYVFILASFTLQ